MTAAETPTWRGMVSTFRSTSSRLESLERYTVEPHEESFRLYLEGRPLPPGDGALDDWRQLVAEMTREGKTLTRVRAISGPMTPYARYELDWGYPGNAAAGERILILHVDDLAEVVGTGPVGDFYLFDDAVVLTMDYDAEGRPLPCRLITAPGEVAAYRRTWEEVVRSAVPLDEYLAAIRRQPLAPPPGVSRAA